MVQWESENELNAFRLLDCDPDVTRFHEQPCEIVYVLDGQLGAIIQTSLLRRTVERSCGRSSPNLKREEPDVVSENETTHPKDFHDGATRTGLCWPKTLPCSRDKRMHAFFLGSAGARSPTVSKSSSGRLVKWHGHCAGQMPAVGDTARVAARFFAVSFSGAY